MSEFLTKFYQILSNQDLCVVVKVQKIDGDDGIIELDWILHFQLLADINRCFRFRHTLCSLLL